MSYAAVKLTPAPSLHALRDLLKDVRQVVVEQQEADGSWRYLLEGSVLPEAYAIIAEVLFPPTEQPLVGQLADLIVRKQLSNGGWELYPDQGGDFSTTLEATLALRLAGVDRDTSSLLRARDFLAMQRDGAHLSNLTRVAFASLGILPWSAVPTFPPELALLPPRVPGSFFDFVSFTRVHLPAMLLLGGLKFSMENPFAGEMQALLAPRHYRPFSSEGAAQQFAEWMLAWSRPLGQLMRKLPLRPRAYEVCRKFILSRMEADGTVGSYILSTVFSMFALRALARPEDESTIKSMKEGLRTLIFEHEGEPRMQPCSSTVWDTALNCGLLRDLGVPAAEDVVQRAADYLLEREIRSFDDLRARNPEMVGSAWGFQAVNRCYPDVDDTCAVLDAIRDLPGARGEQAHEAHIRGLHWVYAMQNADGGFSAFDRDCASSLVEAIPFNDMRRAMIDPSSADMTGRTLAFIASQERDLRQSVAMRRALRWLDGDQCADGSWFGRWGIAYLYGTWAALLGYGAAGLGEGESAAVDRGAAWLRSVQNADGGWGESCKSDEVGHYVPRSESTPSQSAWALEGLLAVSGDPLVDPVITRGVSYLQRHYQRGIGWSENYPTGAGFAGKLYLVYHNYRNLWPARALLRYSAAF
ncbi:MAG: hypothetical protein JRH20_12225 [Deltaproteobacteria bacterium]|nr:hypothetical protein [Deltaproteobacteria bacterium]